MKISITIIYILYKKQLLYEIHVEFILYFSWLWVKVLESIGNLASYSISVVVNNCCFPGFIPRTLLVLHAKTFSHVVNH